MQPPVPGDARPIAVGAALGAALATANVYIGLKTGWWESGGILAALIGFVALRRTVHDTLGANVVVQTSASAAASMPAAIGLLGALPALTALGHSFSWWTVLPFAAALSVGGLVVAAGLREAMLEQEKLPFPTGQAIAEIVEALHRAGIGAREKAALVAAAVAGSITVLRDAARWIGAALWWPGTLRGLTGQQLTLGLSASPLLLGFGLMIDVRSGLTLLVGAGIVWAGLAPHVVAQGWVPSAAYDALVGWLLWPGAALLVAAGLTSLAWQGRSIGRALGALGLLRGRSGVGTGMAIAVAAVGVAALARQAFAVPWLTSIAAVALALLGALICARTVGEAGLAPLGPLGQLTQLGTSTLGPVGAAANIGAGQIVAGGVVQAAQTLESFKVGQLTGVTPRRQMRAALAGIAAGLVVSPPAYLLLAHVHRLGSPALPAPGLLAWKALAQLATEGAASLPPHAGAAALVAAASGVVLEWLGRTRVRAFVPSPLLLGLAFLVPAATSLTIAAGAIARWALRRRVPDATLAATGAGAVAGESLLGLVLALGVALGLIA